MQKFIRILLALTIILVFTISGFYFGVFLTNQEVCSTKVIAEKNLLSAEIKNRLKNLPEFSVLRETEDPNYFIGTIKEINGDILTIEKESSDLEVILSGNKISLPIKIMPTTKIYYYTMNTTPNSDNLFTYSENPLAATELKLNERVAVETIVSEISSYIPAKTIKVVR